MQPNRKSGGGEVYHSKENMVQADQWQLFWWFLCV